ncbi:MAG: bifunctional folylpolyglutamate synthase/dihydrofolate synthase [Verrucomicrobiae bacterium]|nr:bifunctional folylpolyglutamate synthase/dihydrofolate synthase [Verrucomicrobiae bacterium]
MTYAETIQFLYGLRWFGAKFGLENTLKLAALAGNPQSRLRFIHVAGTNGKGSTCAMLESIYRTAGLRVGLFTSPHLVSFRERIQVNRELIGESDVVQRVAELQPWLKEFAADHHPTFFEAVTVMALGHFAARRCDLVIWETGLGGRLDATNIVTPLASVITNVQYDHQKWLGATLASIATEKAGIIKPGVPVITGAEEPQALAVIQETAIQRGSPLTLVAPAHTQHPPLDALPLPLPGWHQRMNAAVALATVQVLQPRLPVSEGQQRAGLTGVNWPGRLQLAELPGGRQVLLDGAHNPAGATSLRAALEEHFPNRRATFILGIMQDKDWEVMCELLAPLAGRIVCVPVGSERSADPALLCAACRRTNPEVNTGTCASLAEAFLQTGTDPFVVVAGSLHLIGEAMEQLHLAANSITDEKGLNDWTPRR